MRLARHVRRSALSALSALVIVCAAPAQAWAQSGRPLAAQTTTTPAEALERPARLSVRDVLLEYALARLHEKSGVPVSFSPSFLPRITVSCECDTVTVSRALDQLLRDSGLQYREIDGHVLVHRPIPFDGTPRIQLAQPRYASFDVRRVTPALTGGAKATLKVPVVGTIVGTVTEVETGAPVVNAQVAVDEAGRAFTDAEGRYRITDVTPGRRSVSVTSIGYRRAAHEVDVPDDGMVTVDFALEVSPTTLNELVVTATGEQRRVELGHVVGRINADSLTREAPVSSLSELLNGRVPGLQVFQSQGTVGGEVKVQIRGANSLALNTEPIVIVDGVRYATGAARLASFAGGGPADVEPRSPLNDLNPNDIETIEVVKGPSAAALYGTDAANGVLVITTKRGRPGPARWNTYAKGSLSEIPSQQFPDLYWGWGTVFGEPNNLNWSCSLVWLASGFCTQQDSITVLPNPLNDPALTLFGSKPSWGYGANVAGGRQDMRYYFSGDFEDAIGPIQMPLKIAKQLKQQRGLNEVPEEWRHPNALTKLNLRANVTAVLGATAEVRVNMGYIHSETRSLAGTNNSPYSAGVIQRRPTSSYLGSVNPAEIFVQTSTERTDRLVGSASGQWRPASWLTMRATMGLDLAASNRYSLARQGDTPNSFFSPNGAVQDARGRQLATTAELGATAVLRRGRLGARTAVGAQYVRTLSDALTSLGRDLPPGGTSVGEAANVQSEQSYAETVTVGGYLEETLGWNERLFLTGALRADGASTFGQDYDATVYPKVSVSWLVSEEPFLPRLPGLEELRLRYAFGASGQQPTSAMAQPAFRADRAVEDGIVENGVVLDGLGNPELRPERVREHEFGFDATALGSRMQLGLTWYRRRTVDQILSVQLPPGLGALFTNLGLTTQRGFEAELTASVLDTRLLSWDVTVQHSVHRTRLVDLGGGFAGPFADGGWVEGYPLGARFVFPVLGYADANGDGILGPDEVQIGDNPVYAGESTPPRSQTLTTVLGFFERRLRVSALLERRTGFTQLNQLKQDQCFVGTCRAAVYPSTPLAEQAEIQTRASPAYLEPGDFTRLREVVVALDLPLSLARALPVRSATLTLSARNLALWTDFSGPDPESAAVSGIRGGVAQGIPQSRSWTLRLDLGL